MPRCDRGGSSPAPRVHLRDDILLLNQAFYPDVVATAQYASDLAATLAEQGHRVTVISSRRGYADPKLTFSWSENWRGVRILRCPAAGFSKSSRWKRALKQRGNECGGAGEKSRRQ